MPEANLKSLADAMGVALAELPDKLDGAVSDFVRDYDKSLMMLGIKATPEDPAPDDVAIHVEDLVIGHPALGGKVMRERGVYRRVLHLGLLQDRPGWVSALPWDEGK